MAATTLHPPKDGGLVATPFAPVTSSNWHLEAACQGSDPGLFHGTAAAHRHARAICRRCPVAEVCLWSAMVAEAATPYRYGVWGGCAPPQRHAIADALGRAAGEYERRLHAALEALHSAEYARGAINAA